MAVPSSVTPIFELRLLGFDNLFSFNLCKGKCQIIINVLLIKKPAEMRGSSGKCYNFNRPHGAFPGKTPYEFLRAWHKNSNNSSAEV